VQKRVFDHAVQICPLNAVKEVRYFGNHRPAVSAEPKVYEFGRSGHAAISSFFLLRLR